MVCDATRIVRYFGHQWVGWVVVIVNLGGGGTEAAFLATQVSAGTPSHLTQIYGFLEYVNNH